MAKGKAVFVFTAMVSTTMNLLGLCVICLAMFKFAEGQIGIPQIIYLLNSVNDTSTTVANSLEANHDQTTAILRQMAINQTQLATSLSALEADHNQTKMILSQLTRSQAQIASTLNQVVLILTGKTFNIQL